MESLKKLLRRSGITLLFVAILSIGAFWNGLFEPARESVTLPDGTRFTLVRTSWGTEHRYGGSPLAGLAPYISAFSIPWRPEPPAELISPLPSAGIWLHAEGTSALNPRGSFTWEILDRSGMGTQIYPSIHHGKSLLGFACSAFPRRDPFFTLRLTSQPEGTKEKVVREFRIKNPVPGWQRRGYPVWTPEPLPAMRKSGDLEIEMLALRRMSGSESGDATAEFRIQELGKPAPHWFPDGVTLRDSTGNVLAQSAWMHQSDEEKKRTALSWSPALWVDPGGWRARFEFSREPKASFSNAERFQVTSTSATGETLVVNGHTIRVTQVPTTSKPQLQIQASPPLLDKQLDVITATDDRGRQVLTDQVSWSRPEGTYSFGFRPEPDAKGLTVTLALHQSVFVEFLAMPEAVK